MKRTNKQLLQYDEFWKNNCQHTIRYIVNKFIKEYDEKAELLNQMLDDDLDDIMGIKLC